VLLYWHPGRLAAVLAGLHALQSLGILPYFIGKYTVHAFNFWDFLMWRCWSGVCLAGADALAVDKQAWLFLAVITVFNLILDSWSCWVGPHGRMSA